MDVKRASIDTSSNVRETCKDWKLKLRWSVFGETWVVRVR